MAIVKKPEPSGKEANDQGTKTGREEGRRSDASQPYRFNMKRTTAPLLSNFCGTCSARTLILATPDVKFHTANLVCARLFRLNGNGNL